MNSGISKWRITTQRLAEKLNFKDLYLLKQVQNVDRWNKLLITDQYPELLEELN